MTIDEQAESIVADITEHFDPRPGCGTGELLPIVKKRLDTIWAGKRYNLITAWLTCLISNTALFISLLLLRTETNSWRETSGNYKFAFEQYKKELERHLKFDEAYFIPRPRTIVVTNQPTARTGDNLVWQPNGPNGIVLQYDSTNAPDYRLPLEFRNDIMYESDFWGGLTVPKLEIRKGKRP